MQNRYRTRSADDTQRFGATLAGQLRAGDAVYLIGDLGSGKSVLARGAAHALGVDGVMPSPTFTLMQPYEGHIPVYHFDLYRLEDIDEYYAAGLDEYVNTDGVALIEWPLDGLGAEPRAEIRFERGGKEDERRMELTLLGLDSRAEEIRVALREWEERA